MRQKQVVALVALGAVLTVALHATEPNADTRAWWAHIQALANDTMQGRDTGSPEHRKAAEYVARHFEQNGIRPAGESGYFQPVPLHAMRLRPDRSDAVLTRNGRTQALRWLQHITLAPAAGLPDRVAGALVFIGSDNGASVDTAGKVVVRLNPVRLVEGPPQPAPPPGVAAVIGIDSATGPEPARWPAQYAVTMTLAETPKDTDPTGSVPRGSVPPGSVPRGSVPRGSVPRAEVPIPRAEGPVTLRFNPAFADLLLNGTGHTYKELLDLAAQGRPLPSFPLGASLQLVPRFETQTLSSDNVIGVLPGSDPALAAQHVVLTAHIDGYGIGEPWKGDRIYNGAFDDAAYVATLLDFAEKLRRSGTRLRRSLLFALVTGEEKGLLGSRYYTQHLTVPKEHLVANINLDQLRPVFPLHTLTMHALDESTLGETVRRVAETMNIRIQADPEPLRNLLRRSDNFSFMQIGVPATGFIFGYAPGSADEAAYRRWYTDRYHTPLDDLSQPWVPEAAAKFNDFFGRVVTELANADEAPRWNAGRPNDGR